VGRPGEIEIQGASAADRQIAADLRTYVVHNCGFGKPRNERRTPKLAPNIARIVNEAQRVCDSYRQFAVTKGVITAKTTLGNEDKGLGTRIVCDTIQGADVADFTPGHKVVDQDGDLLAACPTRTD
jgi:hypothetical protein